MTPSALALCWLSWIPVLSKVQEDVPLTLDRIDHEGGSVTVVAHLGRTCLRIEGTRAWLRGVELANGVIEFDIAAPATRSFAGVAWHAQDPASYEYFYVRPHQSGFPDACQYTPVFHGSAGWQLYSGPGFGAPITFQAQTWTPIRVAISEGRAEISVGDGGPQVLVRELLLGAHGGGIGLIASSFGPADFSNLRITPMDRVAFTGGEPPALTELAGRIEAWSVSSPFAGALLGTGATLERGRLGELTWQALPSALDGVTNLARLHGLVGAADTMLARVTVRAETARTVPLRFGFSDRVRVYLNDRLLYAGDDSYRSRDHRFLGTVGAFDELWL